MENNINNNINNNIELAEGWFEEDSVCLCTAMRNRGVSNEIQQRIIERIIERGDATDRHDEIEVWLWRDEGINRLTSQNICVDWLLQHPSMGMTLEQIQEQFGIGFQYIPISVQDQVRG
jgi:hypothetical protein